MLSNLKIENIAVIKKAVIDFKDGFNVMTGETGASEPNDTSMDVVLRMSFTNAFPSKEAMFRYGNTHALSEGD